MAKERVKKEIINYFASSNHEESFNIFKNEFFDLLDKDFFSEKDAEDILKDFFQILDKIIENRPELRDKFQLNLVKKIDKHTSKIFNGLENFKKSQIDIENRLKEIKEDIKNEFSEKSVPKPIANYNYIESIPKNKNFIGRSIELKEFEEAKSQIIILEGIAGIGKTSLAAELASKNDLENNVFWYSLNGIVTAKAILYQLASFLNQRQHTESYRLINAAEDLNYLADIIINDLEKGNYFLFFDDYHSIKDEQIKAIFEKFKKKSIRTKIVVTTRPNPEFKFYSEHDTSAGVCLLKVLKGLNYEDTKEKLSSLDCKFEDEVILKMHEKTTGHPVALELLAIAAKNNFDLDALISTSPDIPESFVKYLFYEVFSKISNEEQNFLKAISVYRQPVNLSAIRNILENENINEIVIKLIDKRLIEKNRDLYTIHPLIKNLAYTLINNKELFHRRAAENLSRNQIIDLNEIIELQFHLFKAGDYLNSALVSIQTYEFLIRQGYVSPLLEILLLYKEEMLPPKVWIFIGTIIGNICVIRGDLRKAEHYFTEMLKSSKKLRYDNGISSLLNNLSGVSYARGEIDKALKYQLKSLDLYENQKYDIKGKASVLLNIGTTYLEKNDYKKALYYVNKALLEFKKIDDLAGKSDSLNLSGLIYKETGDWDKAIKKFLLAKNAAYEIMDYCNIATISGNLGNIYADRGDFNNAEKEYLIDLEFSKKTEDVHKIQGAYGNLGTLFTDKREIKKALEYYKKSLDISLKYGMFKGAAGTYSNIAKVYLLQEDFDNASENCKKCIKYAKKANDIEILSDGLLTLAGIQEGKGKKQVALRLYEKSIALWEKIGNDYRKAGAYNQFGAFYAENGNLNKAHEYFNKSLKLLDKFNATNFCLSVCSNCIIINQRLNRLNKVIEFQEKKLTYLLSLDDKNNISLTYGDLISNYFKIKNWEKISLLSREKIKLELERNNKIELAYTYNMLAVALRNLENYNFAIKNHKLSINFATESEDNIALATAYNDLGNTYKLTKNIVKSEQCYLESIKIKSKIGNEIGMMNTYVNLGDLYIKTGIFQKGIELLEKAEDFFTIHGRLKEAMKVSQYILDAIIKDVKIQTFSYLLIFREAEFEYEL